MKAIRTILKIVLVFVVAVTLYYVIVRYLVNDGTGGINPTDLLKIVLFLILPIGIGLFLIKRFAKK